MRMYLKVQMPTEKGNEAVRNGSLPKVMGRFMETYRPEGAYFFTVDGERCAHFYFDLKDVSQLPVIAEPFFAELGAKISYCPAMNADELKKGLDSVMAAGATR